MPTITKITTQIKRKDRYNIFLDAEYAFSVDEDILVKYKLKKGLELNAKHIIDLLEAESLQQSYVLAIGYLSYRQRSQVEIERHLYKKEIDPAHIEVVINRLDKEKLIDDLQFAKSFVRERIRQKKKGPQMIKKELFEKGVSKNNADEAVKLMTFNDQYEAALEFAQKRADRPKKESVKKREQQIKSALMQRGYDSDVISEVMQAVDMEENKDDEWDAIKHHGEKLYRRYSQKTSGYELRQKLMSALYTRGFKGEQVNQFIDEIMTNEE